MKANALIYVAVSIFVAGFTLGWSAHIQWTAGDALEAVEMAVEAREELGDEITDVAIEAEREAGEVQIVYKTIEKEVIKYVETPAANRVCLDPPALSVLNAAGRGERVSTNPGQPDPALP